MSAGKWTPANTSGAILGTVVLLPVAALLGIVLLFHLGAAIIVAAVVAGGIAWHKNRPTP